MSTAIRRYIRSLALDAYVVGGSVRDELLGIEHTDEDFLVAGVDHAALRAALEPHGRVEEMEVHGQLVGVRLHPSDPDIRRLVRAGIEITPPRAERSTGPGHRHFEIDTGPHVTVAADLGRRDFTVNAIARRLSDGQLVDPYGGIADLARRELRVVSEQSFSEDPLRILRGLRLVSQLGFTVIGETFASMRLHADGLRHVAGERIGGGLAADGMGELSKLLLGRDPLTALRLARDTGILAVVLPELAPAVGFDSGSDRRPGALDEHIFATVAAAAAAGAALAVRLAALLHDVAVPIVPGPQHATDGAQIAGGILARLRYPSVMRLRVQAIIRAHAFRLDGPIDARAARRFLLAHGVALADDLVAHKRADLAAKTVGPDEHARLDDLARLLREERQTPHTIDALAVGGADLLALGIPQGPRVGGILAELLDRVVDDPVLNVEATLMDLARKLA